MVKWVGNFYANALLGIDEDLPLKSWIANSSKLIEPYFKLSLDSGDWCFLGINVAVWMCTLLAIFVFVWFVERPVIGIKQRKLFEISESDVDLFHERWLKASRLCPESMSKLASTFKDNGVVAKDPKLALALHSLAGEQGIKGSALYAAHSFKYGIGVSVNLDEYLKWLILASDLGSYKATTELAELRAPKPKDSSCFGYIVVGLALGIALS